MSARPSAAAERDDLRGEVTRLRSTILALNGVIRTMLEASDHRSKAFAHLMQAVNAQADADRAATQAVLAIQQLLNEHLIPDHIGRELTR